MLYFIIIFVSFIIIINLIGLMFSRKLKIWAKKTIKGNQAEIFKNIHDLKTFVIWSPWSQKDPNMQSSFSEEQSTAGAWYKWSGNRKVGKGSMQIQSLTDSQMEVELKFGNRISPVTFTIEQKGEESEVIWSIVMDLGPVPASRLMGRFITKLLMKDFIEGLNNLKNHVEKA